MASPFEGWICEHQRYDQILHALVKEIERKLAGGESFIFVLLGPSGAGKTELLKDVVARFSTVLSQSGHPRVLRVPMPTILTGDALAIDIVEAILGTSDFKGSMRKRATDLLADSGTILLLDEINHLAEARRSRAAQSKENRALGDWLKVLFDRSVAMGLSGLPHSISILIDNNQLERRALRPEILSPYDWGVPEEQVAFREVVQAFVTRMQLSGWTIAAPPGSVIRGAYVCSGGLVGKVRDIFQGAFELGDTTKCLDLPLLARAFDRKFPALEAGNPFIIDVLTDELLNQAYRRTLARDVAPAYQEKAKAARRKRGPT